MELFQKTHIRLDRPQLGDAVVDADVQLIGKHPING